MPIRVPAAPGPSPRSANMRANRRRDTTLELEVRSRLHEKGLRYRVDHPIRLEDRRTIRPDIVFTRLRICVELDGCWWHGCEVCGRRETKANRNYWSPKIARNKERDAEQTAALEASAWTVLRFWEHEGPDAIAAAVEARVEQARASLADTSTRGSRARRRSRSSGATRTLTRRG